jgi:hypothetical protein
MSNSSMLLSHACCYTHVRWRPDTPVCCCNIQTVFPAGFRGMQLQLDLAHVARVNWFLDALSSGPTEATECYTA